MVMCCLGRAFHAAALARKEPKWNPPNWLHAGLRRRRRESAMGAQLVGSYRVQAAGITHAQAP
eukprot:3147471-Pyramimonas_sp.AAC.1